MADAARDIHQGARSDAEAGMNGGMASSNAGEVGAKDIKGGDHAAGAHKKPCAHAESLAKKVLEYENDLKRLQAEFENYQKRAAKEKANAREAGRAEALMQLISIYEELGAACSHMKNSGKDDIVRGIELLHKKMGGALDGMGVAEIEAKGEIDPHLHEVLMREEGGEEGHVARILRKGWRLGDNLIRPAQVSVYAGAKKENAQHADEKKQKAETVVKENEKADSGANAQE